MKLFKNSDYVCEGIFLMDSSRLQSEFLNNFNVIGQLSLSLTLYATKEKIRLYLVKIVTCLSVKVLVLSIINGRKLLCLLIIILKAKTKTAMNKNYFSILVYALVFFLFSNCAKDIKKENEILNYLQGDWQFQTMSLQDGNMPDTIIDFSKTSLRFGTCEASKSSEDCSLSFIEDTKVFPFLYNISYGENVGNLSILIADSRLLSTDSTYQKINSCIGNIYEIEEQDNDNVILRMTGGSSFQQRNLSYSKQTISLKRE